ncbi:MAG: OmpA family protein [Gammaproteobacteria bacterium]|nr:OmpA family protein [Gammaproteobacteria bacterium]
MSKLDEAVRIMNEHPGIRINVEGHTDSMGSDAYNQKLSDQRSASVVSYLLSKGVAADRMRARGFGESRPVASNDTGEGRAQNRRVDLIVAE